MSSVFIYFFVPKYFMYIAHTVVTSQYLEQIWAIHFKCRVNLLYIHLECSDEPCSSNEGGGWQSTGHVGVLCSPADVSCSGVAIKPGIKDVY